MISVATAMLCKEQGITVTAICAVYEIFVIQKVSLLLLMDFGIFPFAFQTKFSYVREKVTAASTKRPTKRPQNTKHLNMADEDLTHLHINSVHFVHIQRYMCLAHSMAYRIICSFSKVEKFVRKFFPPAGALNLLAECFE